jgi:hypothetical protein
MKAIYRGNLAHITEHLGEGVVLDGELYVSFADLGLIIDPTDAQVVAAKTGEKIPLDDDESVGIAAFLRTVGLDNETVDATQHLWTEDRAKQIQRRT